MITIFNRKELAITFSLNKQAEIKDALISCGIDYTFKVIIRNKHSGYSGTRMSFVPKQDSLDEYIFYVKKKDYEHAKSILISLGQ